MNFFRDTHDFVLITVFFGKRVSYTMELYIMYVQFYQNKFTYLCFTDA